MALAEENQFYFLFCQFSYFGAFVVVVSPSESASAEEPWEKKREKNKLSETHGDLRDETTVLFSHSPFFVDRIGWSE